MNAKTRNDLQELWYHTIYAPIILNNRESTDEFIAPLKHGLEKITAALDKGREVRKNSREKLNPKLEHIIREYKIISNDGFRPKQTNKYLREIESMTHGAKFVITKYFRDPQIKDLKERHTEAVHEDLIATQNIPYDLAVKIAKGTPMPIQSAGAKGLICTLWGVFGPGRTYHELFKKYSKYSGLKEEWLYRGTVAADLMINDWSGSWFTGIAAYPLDKLVNYVGSSIATAITGKPSHFDLPLTEIAVTTNVALSYAETIRDWIKYEIKGVYTHSKMIWTRAPSNLMFQLPAYTYEKYVKKRKNLRPEDKL